MNTKVISPILFLLFVAFNINAQTTFNSENVGDFLIKEITQINNFNLPVKSANDNIFVLDSLIQVYYSGNKSNSLRYYYKYDSKGNLIEEMNYCSSEANFPTNYRYEYLYDKDGNVTVIVYYNFDLNTKQWVLDGKKETNYYPNENRKELIYFLYDTISRDWTQFQKVDSIYDDLGREISITKYQLNDSDEWYIKQKEETTYNEQGIISSIVWSYWDESQNKLEYSRKRVQEYLENGNKTIILFYNFDKNSGLWIEDECTEIVLENEKYVEYAESEWDKESNQWIYIFMYKWTYDIYGSETSTTSFTWDTNENEWKGAHKSETSYYSNGLLESVAYYDMDTTDLWIGTDKKEYLYNDNGQETQIINSKWDIISSDWVYNSKYEIEYNSNNQEVSSAGFNWDVTLNGWITSSKGEKEYNSNGQITLSTTWQWDYTQEEWEIISKRIVEYDSYGHTTKESKYVAYKDFVLELTETEEYFYSKLASNIDNIISESESVKIYPNPANETFTIETQNPKTVFGKLYNLNGELVRNLIVQQGINTYNISELKSGIYFIQVPQKEGVVVRKLVKN